MQRLRTVTLLDVSAVAGHHAMPAALLFISDLAVIAAKSENKKGYSTSEKARIGSRVNNFY